MKKILIGLVALFSLSAFAETSTVYFCDSREVLTGNFTVGSGTKIIVDEEKRTATVFMRPTAPNADWTVAYILGAENEFGRERLVSGKELQDLDVIFSRIGTYMTQPGPNNPTPAIAGALIYKSYNGLTATSTRAYLCSKQ